VSSRSAAAMGEPVTAGGLASRTSQRRQHQGIHDGGYPAHDVSENVKGAERARGRSALTGVRGRDAGARLWLQPGFGGARLFACMVSRVIVKRRMPPSRRRRRFRWPTPVRPGFPPKFSCLPACCFFAKVREDGCTCAADAAEYIIAYHFSINRRSKIDRTRTHGHAQPRPARL
jgi:hypothetical protein